LQAPSLKAAAKKAGVNYRTARRWHGEESFRTELDAARDAAFRQALRLLQGTSTRAVRALLKNLGVDKPSDRTAAARALLEFAFQSQQSLDQAAKLAELEATLSELQGALPQTRSITVSSA
jgi:hypothetical protein